MLQQLRTSTVARRLPDVSVFQNEGDLVLIGDGVPECLPWYP